MGRRGVCISAVYYMLILPPSHLTWPECSQGKCSGHGCGGTPVPLVHVWGCEDGDCGRVEGGRMKLESGQYPLPAERLTPYSCSSKDNNLPLRLLHELEVGYWEAGEAGQDDQGSYYLDNPVGHTIHLVFNKCYTQLARSNLHSLFID